MTTPDAVLSSAEPGQQRSPAAVVDLPPVVFKASSFALTTAHLHDNDTGQLERELAAKVSQAPSLFHEANMVIDLQGVESRSVDVNGLIRLFRRHGIRPIAVRHGSDTQQQQAITAGLGVLPPHRSPREENVFSENRSRPRVWSQPVRSGQQIYASGSDLIVLGMVNPGAEILADGHIHVYAPLRGRALAGAKGDRDARIFTYQLEAELLSIAGVYRVVEDMESLPVDVRKSPAQIHLAGEQLVIEPLLDTQR